MRYELYNTTTGQAEAVQDMKVSEALRRNQQLREAGAQQRWVMVSANLDAALPVTRTLDHGSDDTLDFA